MEAQQKASHWSQHIEEYPLRAVPIVREKGFSVWSLVGMYRVYEGDKQKVLADYGGRLTAEELDAALAYYQDFPDEIDRRLWELQH